MIIVVSERPAVLADLMPLLPLGEDFGQVLISRDMGDVTWSQLRDAHAIIVDTASVMALRGFTIGVLDEIVTRLVLVAPDSESPPWPESGDVRPAYVAWLNIPGARSWLAYWLVHKVTGEPMPSDQVRGTTATWVTQVNDPPLPSDQVRAID